MGLMKKFFNNTRKPEGFLGKMMVNGMNGSGHAALAEWGFGFINIGKTDTALDCGCGGGANVKRLLEKCQRAVGLDYSPVSVAKAKEVNAPAIAGNRCRIVRGDVASLPFKDESMDVVTAFETVYFWQEIEKAFAEIYRVLKPGGTFALHDIFSKNKYGDMEPFLEQLRKMGYKKVELINTADKFMSPGEAKMMMLSGSALLYGIK